MADEERDLSYFIRRFEEVADEAKQHGLSVVVLLENADPIAQQASYTKVVRGTPATTVGLLQMALTDFHPRA